MDTILREREPHVEVGWHIHTVYIVNFFYEFWRDENTDNFDSTRTTSVISVHWCESTSRLTSFVTKFFNIIDAYVQHAYTLLWWGLNKILKNNYSKSKKTAGIRDVRITKKKNRLLLLRIIFTNANHKPRFIKL